MGFGEYLSLAPAPPEARVGGRSVLLIPARAADLGPDALPADYQRLLTIVRDAAGPVTVRTVACGAASKGRPGAHRVGVNNNKQTGDAVWPVYQCALPLSSNTVNYVADLLRAHLKAIGSRWRSRSAGQIAVLVLAVLRHDQHAADLAGGNAVSVTTIRRWCDEVIALLAAKTPRPGGAERPGGTEEGAPAYICHMGFSARFHAGVPFLRTLPRRMRGRP